MTNPFENKSNAYWADGEACVSEGCWNPAAHSLYYAVFQAVYGFAERKGILKDYTKQYIDPNDSSKRTPSKHDAVRSIVKQWKGPTSLKALKGLYAARITADYHAQDVTEQQIRPYIQDANAIRDFFINVRT